MTTNSESLQYDLPKSLLEDLKTLISTTKSIALKLGIANPLANLDENERYYSPIMNKVMSTLEKIAHHYLDSRWLNPIKDRTGFDIYINHMGTICMVYRYQACPDRTTFTDWVTCHSFSNFIDSEEWKPFGITDCEYRMYVTETGYSIGECSDVKVALELFV